MTDDDRRNSELSYLRKRMLDLSDFCAEISPGNHDPGDPVETVMNLYSNCRELCDTFQNMYEDIKNRFDGLMENRKDFFDGRQFGLDDTIDDIEG